MGANDPVYHHLIPQTYMKPWCFKGDSVWAYNKATQVYEVRNITNICGRNYFYSICVGALYVDKKSLNKIWEFLDAYNISFDGEPLSTPEKMNQHYADFDKWEIRYPAGASIKRKDRNRIKQKIQQTKDNDIEKQWNIQFEDGWRQLSSSLYEKLKKIKQKESTSLTIEVASDLMRYIVMFDWRGFKGNIQFNEVMNATNNLLCLSAIDIPEAERTNPQYKTALDEIRHNSLIRIFAQFLDRSGPMYEQQRIYEENLTFQFLFAANDVDFITSDNPCFSFTNKDGYLEVFFVVLPSLAISLAKKDPANPHSCKIIELDKVETAAYNYQIFEHAEQMVLSTAID